MKKTVTGFLLKYHLLLFDSVNENILIARTGSQSFIERGVV
ncbi:MAG: hypothetical protein ABSG73_07990 [Candidatus Aminicenantales bacterium]